LEFPRNYELREEVKNMGAILTNPAVKAVIIRTAKNILILGATATAAFFSNSIFRTHANNALQSAMEDYGMLKSVVKG
jgi:hypothetical protein